MILSKNRMKKRLLQTRPKNYTTLFIKMQDFFEKYFEKYEKILIFRK